MSFDAAAAVKRAMHLAAAVGAAWARDEMMVNPRTFKAPAAEQALRAYLEQAFTDALASGVTAVATTSPESGCDYCRNPLFASLKCPGCGRTATNGGA